MTESQPWRPTVQHIIAAGVTVATVIATTAAAFLAIAAVRPETFAKPSREDQMFAACIRALGSRQGESPLCERVLFGDVKK